MATIEKIQGKTKTSYRITVYTGTDCKGQRVRHRMNFVPEPGLTARQTEKAVKRAASDFERSIEQGFTLDKRWKFGEYADYVIDLKQRTGTKLKTIDNYKMLSVRTKQALGHMALQDIRPTHLNMFYKNLSETGIRDSAARAVPKADFLEQLKKHNLSKYKVAQLAGLSIHPLNSAASGSSILRESAVKIAEAVGVPFSELFTEVPPKETLSTNTILLYHAFVHTVLTQAEKEMLIPYNAADKVTLPKKEKAEVGTFQTSELAAIRDAAAQEPIKWRMIIHLLMITGCRRGEIVGLKWENINWQDSSIHVESTLIYSRDKGIYESSTKTDADRTIKLPAETMALLKEYKQWFLTYKVAHADRWLPSPYVFTKREGGGMAPDTLGSYLRRFEEKYQLPHIHAHKFRHSMASILYYAGADPVSISKRLGHAQVSTTQDIYSHLINQADTRSAESIADAIFRSDRKSG